MNSLNKSQLAFILDIKAEDARAKMCIAWCSSLRIENEAKWNEDGKIIDPYPAQMGIGILQTYLNFTIPSAISR